MSKFLDLNGLAYYNNKIKEYVDSHGTQVPVITLQISQVVSIEPPAFLLTDEQYDLLLQTNFVRIDCSNVGMDNIVLMYNLQNDYYAYFTHVHSSGIDSIDVNKSTKIATLTTLYFASDVEIGIEDEQFIDDTHFYLTEIQEQQISNNSMFSLNSWSAAHDFSYKMFDTSAGFIGVGEECLVNLIYDYDDPDTGLEVYHIEEHPIGGGSVISTIALTPS